ncbi:dolichyl-diphosphooligosaccharide--protein glycosyltransferase subunit 1 [Linderina macrospora]|uniref:Dolichyl-diphosphooligosaccharide--protein glycosyltransferase subunit 1 n=1 Tax=Linderina macrospora TaxID=4868 RepID=A0ACC1JHG2_9FUNG|nr:dolichyl-diphosphooligosaccharide--protein glycosyltransferase subunit 1 [Linderina macrospora]
MRLLLVSGTLSLLAAAVSAAGLVHTNLIRTVDLRSAPFIHEQIGAVLQNEHASKQYKSYTIAVPFSKQQHLSSLTVHERKSGQELDTVKLEFDSTRNVQLYRATLRKPLAPNDKLSLNVDMVLSNWVMAKPAKMGQAEDQRWVWQDDVLVKSIYPTRKQKTVVKAAGVTRYTKLANATKDAKAVTFGPFDESAAAENVEVAYRSNKEQVTAVHRREYFVSHWGDDLNILEHYAMTNRGPELADGFDKVQQTIGKFMKQRDNFIKTMLVRVPVQAREMFFVDEIGNVSTSAVTSPRSVDDEEFKILQIKPRYPVAGGWNYTWWHGYSLPLAGYLKVDSSKHLLKVPFIGAISASASQAAELTVDMAMAKNVAVTEYELRITLPEGARDIEVKVPFRIDEVAYEPTKYYLDSAGRTTVVVRHRNVDPDMHKDILVTYTYSVAAFWQKPVVIAAVVFAVFALAMGVGRLQFGLPKAKSNKKKTA